MNKSSWTKYDTFYYDLPNTSEKIFNQSLEPNKGLYKNDKTIADGIKIILSVLVLLLVRWV